MKKIALIAFATMMACTTFAQDKLASIAPVEKRMRTIDSLSLARMLQKESLQDPASALYPEWNNTYTTNYGIELPTEYKIDLRGFHMPCDSRLVTSSYGYRRSFRRNHYGTDIKVYIGDTIRAAFSGKIRVVAYNARGYGKYVIIRHPNGLETVYGHMSKQLVEENQTVRAGEPIGLGGNTGRSTGSHLHFETRFLGQFIDPEKLFDFAASDIKADMYVFRSQGKGFLVSAEREAAGGEDAEYNTEELALARRQAEQKREESREFQQERRKAVRSGNIHKVRSGETLSTIARKHGVTVRQLCRMNNITERTILRPGQILRYS